MTLAAGVARTCITPFRGVELTGWGYYLERTWQRIRDHLHATALVLENGETAVAIVSLDLMVLSAEFTRHVRETLTAASGISPAHILVCCTHSHNAPASGGLLGVGEVDPLYEAWAAKQAATAAILAWENRGPARVAVASTSVAGLSYNRTREDGPIDPALTTLRVDRNDGSPLAIVVNFQAHPTVYTRQRSRDVTRDVPGEICDALEAALPGATAIYLQGACGDVNFLPDLHTPARCHEPARTIAASALACQVTATWRSDAELAAASRTVHVPTRRWTREELEHDRSEARRRLQERDVSNWQATIGRAMTNNPADMVERHGGDEWKAVEAMCRFNLAWTSQMLQDLETRPEVLQTEVQALRIGELGIVANSSELFSSFAVDLRRRSRCRDLMIACYANGRIGYVPDAHDISRRSYAAYQSPKYCNQFPFVPESGPAFCDGMLRVLERCGQSG